MSFNTLAGSTSNTPPRRVQTPFNTSNNYDWNSQSLASSGMNANYGSQGMDLNSWLGNDSAGPGSYDKANPTGAAGGGSYDWGGAMDTFNTGAQGILGLAGAYNAYQQAGLMEDQLNMQRGVTNRNLANSALTTNNNLRNQADMAAQMTTGADYGSATMVADADRRYNAAAVDGSPI